MISEKTILELSRLTKGAKALTEPDLRDLLMEIKHQEVDEVLRAVFAPKRKLPKPKLEVPSWLKSMEAAKKRLSWKSLEAVDRLYELAKESGFEPVKKKTTFPAAAKDIANDLGGDRINQLFVDWVDEFASTHAMI